MMMATYDELEERWRKKPYHGCRQPYPVFADEGVLLGLDCVICKSTGRTARGVALAIDGQEGRILALLSLAHGRLIHPEVIRNFRNAARALARGETALAAIHLCHAGLPRLDGGEKRLKLLFQAEQLLDDGLEPGELLKGLEMLPEGASGEQWTDFIKTAASCEGEARDDHGRWTDGGGDGGASDKPADGRVRVADNRPLNTANDATPGDGSKAVTVKRGADGSTIVSNYQTVTDIAGDGKYRGQCVSLVRELSGLPATWQWEAGARIKGYGDPALPEGTIIATMDEHGKYPQDDVPKHTAVFVKYEQYQGKPTMIIYDQYVRKDKTIKSPGERRIWFDNSRNIQNNAYSYSVVKAK